MQNFISVSVLNSIIHNVICAEDYLRNIRVCGEVSQIKIIKGNAYFTLKDAEGVISCSCFSIAKTYVPNEGDSVVITGSVDYYSKGGKLSLIANKIEPFGKGLLALQLEALKHTLSEQGYFSEAVKKQIPAFCNNICVITSKKGAVIKDIVRTIRMKNTSINIYVYDVRVQGEESSNDIIQALKLLDSNSYDCIIIARGGGSVEDLMPFNSEKLVYAIYNCKTPIISAVGHESDVTLCDLVSDYRAATPTAAGEKIAFSHEDIVEYFANAKAKLIQKIESKLIDYEYRRQVVMDSIGRAIDHKTSDVVSKTKLFIQKFQLDAQAFIIKKEMNFSSLIAKLNALNPKAIMKQGYFVLKKQNKTIKQLSDLKIGNVIEIIGIDGKAIAEIKEI